MTSFRHWVSRQVNKVFATHVWEPEFGFSEIRKRARYRNTCIPFPCLEDRGRKSSGASWQDTVDIFVNPQTYSVLWKVLTKKGRYIVIKEDIHCELLAFTHMDMHRNTHTQAQQIKLLYLKDKRKNNVFS